MEPLGEHGTNWYWPAALPSLVVFGFVVLTSVITIPWATISSSWVVAMATSVGLGFLAQSYSKRRNPVFVLVKPGWWRPPFGRWRPIAKVVGVRTEHDLVFVSYLDERGHLQDQLVCHLTPKEGIAFREEVARTVSETLGAHRERVTPQYLVNPNLVSSDPMAHTDALDNKAAPNHTAAARIRRRWRVFTEDANPDAGYREKSFPKGLHLTLAPAAGVWAKIRSWFSKAARPKQLWLPQRKIKNTKFIAEQSGERWHVRPQDKDEEPIAEDLSHEEAAELVAILKRER